MKPKTIKTIPIVIHGYLYCGRCGKNLSATNKTELERGYCSECIRIARPLPGQLPLPIEMDQAK